MGLVIFVIIIAVFVGVVYALKGEGWIAIGVVIVGLIAYFFMSSVMSSQKVRLYPGTDENNPRIYQVNDGRLKQETKVNPDGSVTTYESMSGH